MRRILVTTALAVVGLLGSAGVAAAAGAGGVTGPSFYVDGALYRTVGTPTDLSNTNAPADSFDTIYEFFGVQPFNVATAAPGDADYNGGRWRVQGLEFEDYDAALAAHDANASGDFDSEAEVLAAVAAGDAENIGVVKSFVCPAIKINV